MNFKNAIKHRAAEARQARNKLYNMAVDEYLEKGNTRRFRRLWRSVVSLDEEQIWLQELERAKSTTISVKKEAQIGFDTSAVADDDEEDAADGYDEVETFGGIYCIKESHK